ncbi:MAG: GTPase Era [Saprospiraceae bacterium]|nr:GTPase Era [Saprospiraceae bacterium]
MHKSGFVNIIGNPNVGKSTLMNALLGERMSIITNKPQTTRHRIIGIWNDDDHQIVFSDTPGIIQDPHYKMQESMNHYAFSTFEDADVMIYMADILEPQELDEKLRKKLIELEVPLFILINKVDVSDQKKVEQAIDYWKSMVPNSKIFPISALEKKGTEHILKEIFNLIPESPPFYPKDQLTDKSERFFVSEIVREKILELYHQEIPYSCEVIVESFKEGEARSGKIIRIAADIYVSRKSQKSILIGKNGSMIKRLGTEARKSIEIFLEEKVFLELRVKVKENWRDDDRLLKHFGY